MDDPDTKQVWTTWAELGFARAKMVENGQENYDDSPETSRRVDEHEREYPEGIRKRIGTCLLSSKLRSFLMQP